MSSTHAKKARNGREAAPKTSIDEADDLAGGMGAAVVPTWLRRLRRAGNAGMEAVEAP